MVIRMVPDKPRVALLAEGVDRNLVLLPGVRRENGSPSSRRAWIEIGTALQELQRRRVALLAEGVDRNISRASNPPSAVVALLAEGVDRNTLVLVKGDGSAGRPPRGGRG